MAFTKSTACSTLKRLSRSSFVSAALRFLGSFAMILSLDVHAHAARRARNTARGGLQLSGVHVRHLFFGDSADLVPGELAHLVLVGLLGTRTRLAGRRQPASLLDENARRGRLHHERV